MNKRTNDCNLSKTSQLWGWVFCDAQGRQEEEAVAFLSLGIDNCSLTDEVSALLLSQGLCSTKECVMPSTPALFQG